MSLSYRWIAISVFFSVFGGLSLAGDDVSRNWKGDFVTRTFTPSESCGLTRFTLATVNYSYSDRTQERRESRMGAMAAHLETSDTPCLKEFAVVQWIRGCLYSQMLNRSTGEEDVYAGVSRESRGNVIPFIHPDWEVDAVDPDPLFNRNTVTNPLDPARLDYYRIPKTPVNFSMPKHQVVNHFEKLINYRDARMYVYESTLPTNHYFVKDIPSGARWSVNRYDPNLESGTASSLEFQTCVYRVKDIPLSGDPAHFSAGPEAGGPIACLPWQVKQRWNFQKGAFETFEGIDPKCSEIGR